MQGFSLFLVGRINPSSRFGGRWISDSRIAGPSLALGTVVPPRFRPAFFRFIGLSVKY